MKKTYHATTFACEILMIIISIIFIYPIFFMVTAAFRSRLDFADSPAGLPRTFTFGNIIEAFYRMNFVRVFMNSAIITVISLIIILVIGSMAAYAISRWGGRWANNIYLFFTAGMLVPIQVCMIPLYKFMVDLKLLNNLLSCILVYCGAWMTSTIFIYAGFMKTIPRELDEAAFIDGATIRYTFWAIVFPLLKPINATLIIITAIGIWNDFLLPLLYLQKAEARTIQIGLYAFSGIYGTDWTGMFSAMVLTTIPIILLYIFLNKHIMKGIVAGAVKG